MNYFFSDFPFDLGVLFEAIETQIKTTEDYSTFKNNNIIKFAGQWWNLKKNHPELGNPDQERKNMKYTHLLGMWWFQ